MKSLIIALLLLFASSNASIAEGNIKSLRLYESDKKGEILYRVINTNQIQSITWEEEDKRVTVYFGNGYYRYFTVKSEKEAITIIELLFNSKSENWLSYKE